MLNSATRILTTHTGSLPRPLELTAMYAARARGEVADADQLRVAGLAAMRDSIDAQIANGVDVGNNGEQQREGFFLHVRHRMTGFGGSWTRFPRGDVERYPLLKQRMAQQAAGQTSVSNFLPPRVVEAIRYGNPADADIEPRDFRAALDARGEGFVEAFLTAPSPGIIAAACRNDHYPSFQAYLDALSDALRVEYEAIARHGFLLQLDCPDLALERHISFVDRDEREFLAFVEAVVDAINKALANIPPERVRLHLCWGNYEGPHDLDIPLERIWPIVRTAKVGAFVLPFANPRHAHEPKVLAAMPLQGDQLIVAGVSDVLTNIVEHPEVIAERLERVARAVGDPTRVLAGTDCGFDTSAGMGRVAADVVWAKVRALREGARLASQRLFGRAA